MRRKNIAIVGSGISGLSATWLLHKNHSVTVFEKAGYVGGHSHTVDIECENQLLAVDTGFIVFNPPNYPNLSALFDLLDVDTTATDMSFAVSRSEGAFEYSGGDNAGLLAQPRNILRPRFWKMIAGIMRFYRNTDAYIESTIDTGVTLGELLRQEQFSTAFVEDHLAPMGAAIWSADSVDILDYPAASFLKFFKNHGLVQMTGRPQWRTVVGGSREYVKKLSAPFKGQIKLDTPVVEVSRVTNGVQVKTSDGQAQLFDDIVFACHSNQVLDLLKDPTEAESLWLPKMRYGKNTAVLHADRNWLPKRKKAWASWNYIEAARQVETVSTSGPAITYWMNRLQHLPVKTPVLVTLNPFDEIEPRNVFGTYSYDHPIFDRPAFEARTKLMANQGMKNTWYCGAYFGDGFHEDGIQSGLVVAEMLGGRARPWVRENQNARVGLPDHILQGSCP